MSKLVYGVGVNDAKYSVRPTKNGGTWHCPYYQVWARMLERCYSEKYQETRKSYKGCSVCDEWFTFSNFKAWMDNQDWQGKELDKDLLKVNNKIYSPETCVFVDRLVNTFILDNKSRRGNLPIGVCFNKQKEKYQSECSNPFTKKTEYLGYFDCADMAHEAWRARKHELACILSEYQSNVAVSVALRLRYAKQQEPK